MNQVSFALVLLSSGNAFSKNPFEDFLCPPPVRNASYTIFDNVTQQCYQPGTQGPCPPLMTFEVFEESERTLSPYGYCVCNFVPCGDARPIVHFKGKARDECHHVFSQGPCKDSEWLSPGTSDALCGICERNPCPHKKLTVWEEKLEPFWFLWNETCYQWRSQGFCSNVSQRVYFQNNNILKPVCLTRPPNACAAAVTHVGPLDCPIGFLRDETASCVPKVDIS